MVELALVAVETAHIQPYIFSSNRLRENVGASYLVAAATGDWALQCVTEVASLHNVIQEQDRYRLNLQAPHIEYEPSMGIEVLYAGGGNFVGLFRSDDIATEFARNLSQRVILDAPHLHFVIHRERFVWDDGGLPLSKAVGRLLNHLKAQRSHQPVNLGLGGLGVTAMCASTSLPAVKLVEFTNRNDETELGLYSAQALAKHKVSKKANDYLRNLFHLDPYYSFPSELDDLGRSENESSYIAVVHADGNGMGKIITGLFSQIRDNRTYITLMRSFSEEIKAIARDAQQQMIELLQGSIERNGEEGWAVLWGLNNQAPLALKHNSKAGGYFLPFRPLISGGDDVTFVSDGRIGIALAVLFLRIFERQTKPLLEWLRSQVEPLPEMQDTLRKRGHELLPEYLTACAGIAIVKTHYPFARAYDLAEELCQSSKKMIRNRQQETGENHSALDWHFTGGGLYGELDVMREREYIVPSGSLSLRPVFLDDNAHKTRNWPIVERVTTEFQVSWQGSRNKSKDLMHILRQGPAHTQLFSVRYLQGTSLRLPAVAGFDGTFGWQNNYCGYYDALELMDLYLPLNTQELNHG